jgi:uncharacterized membrane protein
MKKRNQFGRCVIGITLLTFTMGHGGEGCCSDEAVLGPATGAECPPTSTLTYDNFGRTFMESYCTRCHSSELTGAAREGATRDHDFDTHAGIVGVADHIDQAAGAGPNATNDQMPPDGDMPTLAERQQLAEWIACGAP